MSAKREIKHKVYGRVLYFLHEQGDAFTVEFWTAYVMLPSLALDTELNGRMT